MRAIVLVASLIAAVSGGCDSTFTPFVERPSYFIMGGYLDASADTQFVRLNTLRQTIKIDEHLRAEVRTIDRRTGRVRAWRDSLVELTGGVRGRLFYSVFSPEPGHTYRLVATAPGVTTAEATVRVPPAPEFQPGAALEPAGGDTSDVAQEVLWRGLEYPVVEATVIYYLHGPIYDTQQRVPVNYTGHGARTGTGHRYIIALGRDRRTIRERLRLVQDTLQLRLTNMTMHLVVRDQAPSSNVMDGRGTFGAVIRPGSSWLPPDSVIEASGFAAPASEQATVGVPRTSSCSASSRCPPAYW